RRVGGDEVDLARVGVNGLEHLAGKPDVRARQTEAEAQERTAVDARPADRANLALHAGVAEAAWDKDARHALQLVRHLLGLKALEVLAADPAHLDVDAMVERGVLERL